MAMGALLAADSGFGTAELVLNETKAPQSWGADEIKAIVEYASNIIAYYESLMPDDDDIPDEAVED